MLSMKMDRPLSRGEYCGTKNADYYSHLSGVQCGKTDFYIAWCTNCQRLFLVSGVDKWIKTKPELARNANGDIIGGLADFYFRDR
jgi:hypothetical protein